MVSHSPPCHLLLPLALRLLTLSLDRGQDSSAGESHLAHLGLLRFLLHSNASIARPLKLYSTVFEQFLLPYLFHLSVYLRGPGNAYVIVVNPSSELHPQPWSHIAKLTLAILYSDSLEESDAGICFQSITVNQSSLLYGFEFVSADRCVCSPVPNLSVIAPLHRERPP